MQAGANHWITGESWVDIVPGVVVALGTKAGAEAQSAGAEALVLGLRLKTYQGISGKSGWCCPRMERVGGRTAMVLLMISLSAA